MGLPSSGIPSARRPSRQATYGSEFIAAWIATDQIIDLRTTLRYLGVKILDELFMFGDNQAVITSSTLPELPLNKRHNILSYHQVRKAVALKMLQFKFVKSCDNAANILSKNVPGPQAWTFAYPLLFCAGQPRHHNNAQDDTSQSPQSVGE